MGTRAYGSVQGKRCLGGDMNLEIISIYNVVEARGGNELTLRKGGEAKYLGHKVKKKKTRAQCVKLNRHY